MTTLKQIEANRRNAQSSTGPRTEAGKERSSRNAVRHGLTAETVIEPLEDAEDYQAFEEAVAADFDAETAVERELILRLASLLWRLRRATSIETGLFQIGSASSAEHEQCLPGTGLRTETPNAVVRIVQSPTNPLSKRVERANRKTAWNIPSDNRPNGSALSIDMQLLLAQRFMGLEDLNGAFERISRYEVALWRQVRQIVFTLSTLQRRHSGRRYRMPQDSWKSSEAFSPD